MFRSLAIVAAAAFVLAALCFAGAAALAGPDIAKSEFWRDFNWNGDEDGGEPIRFDPNAPVTTQVRELTGFTSINVGGGVKTDVTVGPEFKVEVIGAAPDMIVTEVIGTQLEIHTRRQNMWRGFPRTRVQISMPAFAGVSAGAGADVDVTGINGGDVRLDASSGASLDVSGTCAAIDVEVSSGARIDADELVCANGDAEASSGGSIDMHVTGRLDVEASSGGSIDAAGSPQIGRVDLSSGGSLDRN